MGLSRTHPVLGPCHPRLHSARVGLVGNICCQVRGGRLVCLVFSPFLLLDSQDWDCGLKDMSLIVASKTY